MTATLNQDVTNWRALSACRSDPERMFPEDESGHEPWHAPDDVKAICDRCPVRYECLQDGLDEPFGVRAGMSGPQRMGLRRPKPRKSCVGCGSTMLVTEPPKLICVSCGLSHPIT